MSDGKLIYTDQAFSGRIETNSHGVGVCGGGCDVGPVRHIEAPFHEGPVKARCVARRCQ